MGRLVKRVGSFVLFARGADNVRGGVVFLFTQFLLVLSVLFIAECLLILLGITNVCLPFKQSLNLILEKIVY